MVEQVGTDGDYLLYQRHADQPVADGVTPRMAAQREGHDAEISWWVVDDHADSVLEEELAAVVPRWIGDRWPFTAPSIGP